jgi:hypothetical protein
MALVVPGRPLFACKLQYTAFSEPHPVEDTEHFFYNVLISRVPFRDPAALFSPGNGSKSYLVECQLRGVLPDLDALEAMLTAYAERNLLSAAAPLDLLQRFTAELPDWNRTDQPEHEAPADTSVEAKAAAYLASMHQDMASIDDSTLTAEQEHILNTIIARPVGVYVIHRVAGSGKTFIAQVRPCTACLV